MCLTDNKLSEVGLPPPSKGVPESDSLVHRKQLLMGEGSTVLGDYRVGGYHI